VDCWSLLSDLLQAEKMAIPAMIKNKLKMLE
jgi:hypothetical protein